MKRVLHFSVEIEVAGVEVNNSSVLKFEYQQTSGCQSSSHLSAIGSYQEIDT